jgi:heat shock protein HslJ
MMNETDITAMLERTAHQFHVDPPPTAELMAGLRRSRRNRAIWRFALASVAAIVALSGATAASLALRGTNDAVTSAPAVGSSAPAPGNTDLDGVWTVTAIFTNDQNLAALPTSVRGKAELTFDNGDVFGTNGCNSIAGRYKQSGINGQDLSFTREMFSTAVACRDEIPLVERLADVRHVRGSGNTRYLQASSDQVIIELQRR